MEAEEKGGKPKGNCKKKLAKNGMMKDGTLDGEMRNIG
jgi:hypothetical protein